jgi:hypothetical protein
MVHVEDDRGLVWGEHVHSIFLLKAGTSSIRVRKGEKDKIDATRKALNKVKNMINMVNRESLSNLYPMPSYP